MLNFCPKCGNKLFGERFCGNCGADLSVYENGAAASVIQGANSTLDGAIGNLMGFVSENKERKDKEDRLRSLIVRGKYEEAEKLCDMLIDSNPTDKVGYIGLIRITTENYKEYVGAKIDEQIRIAEEMLGGADELLADPEYAKYIAARKKYLDDKSVAEAERIREAKSFEMANGRLTHYTGNAAIVVIPDGVTSIGNRAFADCKNITSIQMPNSVISIEERAFSRCISLTNIEIPNSVTSIGDCAFWNCCGLTSIEIPNSVTSIGDSAFEYCSKLASVHIPDSVTSIGAYAFYGCSFASVSVPSGCKIGTYAFPYDCKVTRR